MTEITSEQQELLDVFLGRPPAPTPNAPDTLSPPNSWSGLVHNEYQSLPKFFRRYIK